MYPTYYANAIQERTPGEEFAFMFYAADRTHLTTKNPNTIDMVFCL